MRLLYCTLVAVFLLAANANAQEYRPLFDGLSFGGWVNAKGDAITKENAPAWEVTDGMLHLDRTKGQGGNLLTDRDYGDFELLFEWKVAPKANNGIKYRVKDFGGRTLGIEYQVIDDYGRPNLKPTQKAAGIYAICDVKEHGHLHQPNSFNRGRIVVQNNHIEHWLNGHLISEITVGSDEWNEGVAKSKFADVPGFGINHFGRIMLTDHKDEVWYRSIFIRELNNAPVVVQTEAVLTEATCACCCPPTASWQTP